MVGWYKPQTDNRARGQAPTALPTHAYVYMYICIHVYMYTCIHVYMYTCIHVYMYTCIHVYMYTCIHVYMYTCIHVYMYICIHTRYNIQETLFYGGLCTETLAQ